ncbi:MAG: phosphate ABC transporter substrate-binding protein, partial [Desulfobacca sp.]|uniref:phosphate ABC transporter substrate-binding protein n=1 Tax=Desulfobacca sp. TaxID=2067990 RepID=UPI00404AB532
MKNSINDVMISRPLRWFCLALLLLACLACGRSDRQSQILTVAGSTSVQPFAEKLAEVYMKQCPGLLINVQGGGSSAGIMAVQQGAAQIGASSRELHGAEKQLHETVIAWDGIAVIVHPSCPLANVSLNTLRQIFAGQIRDWAALGLKPHGIHVITREEGSGTRTAFEELVMANLEIAATALVQDSNGAVREIVAHDPHAIGYISCGLVDQQVKALAIEGVLPTAANIKKNLYKLTRRFLFVTAQQPAGLTQEFCAFVLSSPGPRLLEKE